METIKNLSLSCCGEATVNKILFSQYVVMHPVKNINFQDLIGPWCEADSAVQQTILCSTVLHPHAVRFPASLQYRRSFLKFIIDSLEKVNVEIFDELYEAYTDVISKSASEDESIYKTYCIDDFLIVLKESNSFVSQGTTGLCTWQAAQYLCEWMVEHKYIFENRSVLELGSGLGLAGIVLYKTCQCQRVVMSDCHEQVLKVLRENVTRNCEDTSVCNKSTADKSTCDKSTPDKSTSDKSTCDKSACDKSTCDKSTCEKSTYDKSTCDKSTYDKSICYISTYDKSTCDNLSTSEKNTCDENKIDNGISSIGEYCSVIEEGGVSQGVVSGGVSKGVGVLELDWEVVSNEELSRVAESFNLFIASDVVYDVSIIPALVRLLSAVLCQKKDSKNIALICSTIRNIDTYHSFLNACDETGLKHQRLKKLSHKTFFYNRDTPVELIALTSKSFSFDSCHLLKNLTAEEL